jgi:hypothetical protein
MSSFDEYARFESRRYALSDSESSSETQIRLNECELCSTYDKSICLFPCWNSFEDNKLPGAIVLDGQKKSTIYFVENLDKDFFSGLVFDENVKYMIRTARELLIMNPFIIDCLGRPVTNREWVLELDSLDREILMPERWKGHADIIQKFERKKISEQRDLFAALSEQ